MNDYEKKEKGVATNANKKATGSIKTNTVEMSANKIEIIPAIDAMAGMIFSEVAIMKW